MLMAAYSALLGLGLIVSAPWWLLRMATTERYREGLGERLGRVPAPLRQAVRDCRVIWVHAVSVGEVLAISRLVNDLQATLDGRAGPSHAPTGPAAREPGWRIVISTTTRTGQALARERFGAGRVFFCPLDLRWAVRAYLRALHPALVILAESELWPRLLHECQREAIPVVVVNARVSDRSFRRARLALPLWRPVVRKVAKLLAQSEADAGRLRRLGARPEDVVLVGNLKYDAREPRPTSLAEALRVACTGRSVIVAGSTVEGEDDLVLRSFCELRRSLRDQNPSGQNFSGPNFSGQALPDAVLILAPRHPERFKAAVALAAPLGAIRASSLPEAHPGIRAPLPPSPSGTPANDVRAQEASVIVLDTIGDLAAVYGLADVVFVGGSLVPRGGHNPLEPARFGVPVVTGPSYENFRGVVAAMMAVDGIRVVRDETEFTAALRSLLTNPERARSLGERGQIVFKREGGATARSIQSLMPLLTTSDPARQRLLRASAASREVSA